MIIKPQDLGGRRKQSYGEPYHPFSRFSGHLDLGKPAGEQYLNSLNRSLDMTSRIGAGTGSRRCVKIGGRRSVLRSWEGVCFGIGRQLMNVSHYPYWDRPNSTSNLLTTDISKTAKRSDPSARLEMIACGLRPSLLHGGVNCCLSGACASPYVCLSFPEQKAMRFSKDVLGAEGW